jgi:hypothetical protein
VIVEALVHDLAVLPLPARHLLQRDARLSMGDIDQEVNVQASGEIGELAVSFRRMVNAFKVMNSMMGAESPEDGK